MVRESEIKNLNLVIDSDQKTIFYYEKFVVPSLESKVSVRDSTIHNQTQKYKAKIKVKDVELKEEKTKKWYWLGGGTLLGMILGIVFG